jgi:hypothetical protein
MQRRVNMLLKKINKLYDLVHKLYSLEKNLDQIKMTQGVILDILMNNNTLSKLNDYEYKIFSQWGEDGIIQKLINSLEIPNKTFIEFGIQNFIESNCRYLLKNSNWSGIVIDANLQDINSLKSSEEYWKYDLTAIHGFIDQNNINNIFNNAGISGDIGLLSVDIDGVDWWILDAIDSVSPRILIVEYNPNFGPGRPITVPYDPLFNRLTKHFSGIYYGASLSAFDYLAKNKGYVLVGTNSNGSNAFFVRGDIFSTSGLVAKSVDEVFVDSKVRETRGADGNLTFLNRHQREELLKGMPVINVITQAVEVF